MKCPHEKKCYTALKIKRKHQLIYFISFLCLVTSLVFSFLFFHPAIVHHPDFDSNVQNGEPTVSDRYAYSTLTIKEKYALRLAGVPENDGQNIDLYLTNIQDNDVWVRIEILDEQGEILGQSGVIRNGQYLKTVHLNKPLSQRETPVLIKVIGYTPYTWQSQGNVQLKMKLYQNFH